MHVIRLLFLFLAYGSCHSLTFEQETQEIISSQDSINNSQEDNISPIESDYKQLSNLFKCFKGVLSEDRFEAYKHRKLRIESQIRMGQGRIEALGRLISRMYHRYASKCEEQNQDLAEEIKGQVEAAKDIVTIRAV